MPGAANEGLATSARQYGGLPLIAQFEIDDALQKSPDTKPATVLRITEHRTKGRYLDTWGVAEQAAAYAREHNLSTAVVIAHPNHMPRAIACLGALGIDARAAAGIEAIWPQNSAQGQTRNRWRWAIREIPTIALYALRGWLKLEKTSTYPL